MREKLIKIGVIFFIFFFVLGGLNFRNAYGANDAAIDTIKQNIADRNAKIEQLNNDIKQLDTQIQATSKEGQTLKSTISVLDTQRSKLAKELEITQNEVGATTLTIAELQSEIADGEKRIQTSQAGLGGAIRSMNQAESFSLVETLMIYDTAADLWNEIGSLSQLQNALKSNIDAVEELKKQLAQKKTDTESKKADLIEQTGTLQDQKKIVDSNKSEKARLLADTQSKEAIYKQQLEEKKKLGAAFQQEITAYESQLKFLIDPASYPSATKGILAWPLEKVYITQYFGDTAFSKTTNAYNGKGHNGIDFRASPGTKVMAALDGTVEGTGDTGLVSSCYSYGRWVLIRHSNGLSTLYAHLSLIKVTAGQRVSTGDIIGYSGYTGYVVPPGPSGAHLHFGVYASQGVKIVKYENSINCKNAVIPVADIRAYLNPILYLQ